MSRAAYDIALVVGILLASIGAGLQWGVAIALMAAGLLVLTFNLIGALLFASSRG
jgi:hypothetical protein